jgi:hypothetical protein
MVRCGSITPFAAPVVPDVKAMKAGEFADVRTVVKLELYFEPSNRSSKSLLTPPIFSNRSAIRDSVISTFGSTSAIRP